MNAVEFLILVERMRAAQNRYFRAKAYTLEKSAALDESKKLERQVDAEIKAHHRRVEEEAKKVQQELFN